MTAQDPSRSVTVIVPAWRSAAVLGPCLASAAAAGRVLVVDNASPDDTAEVARRLGAEVLRRDRNNGFGAACNHGLAAVRTPFALLLNPDARLEPGALEALVQAAHRYPDAGLLAPIIRRPDGAWEPNHNVDLARRAAVQRRRDDPPPTGDVCASWLSGAALLVRMAAWERVGGFDEGFFLYYEDDDFCRRYGQGGWSLVLTPAAVCIHEGGASSGSDPRITALKHRHMAWSRLRFAAKHEDGAMARALRQFVVHGAKGLVRGGDKGRRHRARFAGTVDWLLRRPAPRP